MSLLVSDSGSRAHSSPPLLSLPQGYLNISQASALVVITIYYAVFEKTGLYMKTEVIFGIVLQPKAFLRLILFLRLDLIS